MDLFHKDSVHIWVSLYSLAFPSVFRSRLDRCNEGERELRARKTALRLIWTFFFFCVQRPGGRLLELGDESRRRPLIHCTVHCWRRWMAPISSILYVSLAHACERVMHQGQAWLSFGRIRAAGAHTPGLRHTRRSEKDLEKERGSDKRMLKK